MKTAHTLSILASTILLIGCSATVPDVKTDTHLVITKDGSVNVEDRNITTAPQLLDSNISDAQRYNIQFESVPQTAMLDTNAILKDQPKYTTPPAPEAPPPLPVTINDKRPVKLSLEKIPVGKFAEVALGSVLGLNYAISPDAAAKINPVSLNMSSPIKGEDFLAIAQKIMNDNGLTLTRETGSTIFVTLTPVKITPAFNPAVQDTPIFYGREVNPNIPDYTPITMFIPYYYVDMIQPFQHIKGLSLSPNVTYQFFGEQKVVMIKDMAGNIRKTLPYFDLFDRPFMKNKTAQIIPLQYVSPKSFIERLKQILPNVGVPMANKINDLGLFIQDLPESKSLLVFSDKKEWVDQLLYWKEKLDSLSALGDAPQMFVYQVKNRKADELMTLATGTRSGSSPTQQGQTSTIAPSSSGSFASDAKVVADTNTNSLIIVATPQRYREIEAVLQTIDTLPRQVLVEVTIAEITLTDKLAFGLEWYLQHNTDKFSGTLQTLGNLGVGSGGLTGSILKNAGDFSAVVNAFAQKNLINILSRPKLVVLDNQSANINVGTEIPVITSQATAGDLVAGGATSPSILQSVQYRNTGITLTVKPTVNSGGILTLAINQIVSEAQQNNLSNISSPLILNRSINTNVVLHSGESVMLGGLISQNKSDGNTRIPLLGDIPLIGNFFKTTSKSTTKTELVILVKPIILENTSEYTAISKAMGKINVEE